MTSGGALPRQRAEGLSGFCTDRPQGSPSAGRFSVLPSSTLMSDRRVLVAVLFLLSLVLDTRENGFPYTYHPDESGKIEQVLQGDWNFHHPLLLLLGSQAAVRIFHTPPKEQATVVAGRWVSAVFASVAVAVLALLAFEYGGALAGWLCGVIALLHHQFFELAHYMKEDTALVMGVALAFLAIARFHRRPDLLRSILC